MLARWARAKFLGCLVATAVLVCAPQLQGQDVEQTRVPTHQVTDVVRLGDTLWVLEGCGKTMHVFRSSDGGRNWSKTTVDVHLYRMFFLDGHHGWGLATSDSSKPTGVLLMRTDDGGLTWSRVSDVTDVSTVQPAVLTDLLFVDSLHGLVIGQRGGGTGLVLQTSDGGASFRSIGRFAEGDLTRGLFGNDAKGVWVVGNELMERTLDNGQSWRSGLPAVGMQNAYITAGTMRASGVGAVVGGRESGLILTTRDAGSVWRVDTVEDSYLRDVDFFDDNRACALGSSHLYCTQDGGESWTMVSRLPDLGARWGPQRFSRFVMTGPRRGWLVSDSGFLFETSDLGASWHAVDLLAGGSEK